MNIKILSNNSIKTKIKTGTILTFQSNISRIKLETCRKDIQIHTYNAH